MPQSERAGLIVHYTAMMEEVPVGLLLLDAQLRPIWFNAEAARACAVWNHGERGAAALRARHEFKLPEVLAQACRALRESAFPKESSRLARVISDHSRGLHARIKLHAPPRRPLAYHLQLDYRRPRGDRDRPLSPGTVALLARLTEREREAVMLLREGLSNREIARELRRSPLTIKAQLVTVFFKLGLHRRSQVAALLNR